MTQDLQSIAQGTSLQQTPTPVDIPAEIRVYLEAILEEADLLILTEEEQQQVVENMYKQLNMFLLTRVLEKLPEDKMDAFEKIDAEKADAQKVQVFLQEAIPNAKELFENAYDEFRELYLDTIAIEEARMEAVAKDATATSKSLLEKLATGKLVADQ